MTGDVEVEIKLAVLDADLVRPLVEDPDPARLAGFVAAGDLREVVVVDRYIDTASGGLARAGARARVRSGDGDPLLTLKHHGIEAAGVTARHEVEGSAGDTLEAASWPDSTARSELLALAAGEPLREIARLRQRRLVRRIRRGDTVVELSLDALEAIDPRRPDRVGATRWELEAELKAGDRRDLEELAVALDAIPGTSPATGSKLDFALSAGVTPEADPTSSPR